MAYQISDKTKKQSTKCTRMFRCLNNETWDTCSIERDIQGVLLAIITKRDKIDCPYYFSYGNAYYCYCPARCEIYKRFKK